MCRTNTDEKDIYILYVGFNKSLDYRLAKLICCLTCNVHEDVDKFLFKDIIYFIHVQCVRIFYIINLIY